MMNYGRFIVLPNFTFGLNLHHVIYHYIKHCKYMHKVWAYLVRTPGGRGQRCVRIKKRKFKIIYNILNDAKCNLLPVQVIIPTK